jgi:Glycine/D-amino acid oxidases (deaminating)
VIDSADILIVGGGVMGCSLAWHLAMRTGGTISVAVVERDISYRRASSALSLSSIRQQFTTPVNVQMSRYTLDFLRDPTPLAVGGEVPDFQFVERGYLFLGRAGDEADLRQAQNVCGDDGIAPEVTLKPALCERYPWLNTHDLTIASQGREGEGWFDGYSLLRSLRGAARSAGTSIVEGNVVALRREGTWKVLLDGGNVITCSHLVNAAGPRAAEIARMAGCDLPVRGQKRSVFVVDAPDADPEWPLVIDPDGFYFRPEGRTFLVGAPAPQGYADAEDFEPDHGLFDDWLWPRLAHRVPAFERLKLLGAWAGHYEMNILDGNALIGPSGVDDFWLINGFSGHGLQHALAAGRGLAELIIDGRYRSIDLSPLGLDRLRDTRSPAETRII